jgi:hypothetical protein
LPAVTVTPAPSAFAHDGAALGADPPDPPDPQAATAPASSAAAQGMCSLLEKLIRPYHSQTVETGIKHPAYPGLAGDFTTNSEFNSIAEIRA